MPPSPDAVAVEVPRRRPGRSVPVFLWAAVAAVTAAVIAGALALLAPLDATPPWLAEDLSPTTSPPRAVDSPPSDPDEPATDQVLRVAGSGSNLPLTRELTEAFLRRHPDRRIVVFESVGSTGGIQAVRDRVIDLGLISRPLDPSEEALGLVVIPYAEVAVAVATHLGVGEPGIARDELPAIFAGTRRRWTDGTPLVVLQRERGDSSHATVARALPGFAAANDAAYRARRWRVLYNDRALHEALVSTPGAVGLLDVGFTQTRALAVHVLAIDGVYPTEATLRGRHYPFIKELAFVSREPPQGLAADLIDFVRSSDGQALIRQQGYLPRVQAVGPEAWR